MFGWATKITLVATVGLSVLLLFYGFDNSRLRSKIDNLESRNKRDVAKAHIEEIDLSLAEKLKNIEEAYDENVTVDPAGYDGQWVDDFGL